MADNKYLDLSGLTTYDEKIKGVISAGDDSALSQAKSYADSLADNYDPAGTAETKVQELASGQVQTNADNIATLQSNKADKSTTLAGYGITDAYTSAQTDSAIATAVANADHLKRAIVATLPEVEEADENTIYMVGSGEGSEDSVYGEYMLINGGFEKIGSSAVDLTDYALKSYVDTAKTEAIKTAGTNADSKISAKVGEIGASTVKDYVDQAKTAAINDAHEYADGLATNYATAAQGAKADTALQQADITTGSANGSISVKGTDVTVKGLGSAAFVETSSFDAAGTAQNLVDTLSEGQVSTNTNDITTLKEQVSTLQGSVASPIDISDIEALFE